MVTESKDSVTFFKILFLDVKRLRMGIAIHPKMWYYTIVPRGKGQNKIG